MNFKLDPPSGLADSYFDIEFIATFTKSPKSVITLHNDTSDEHLNIIGVALGYILDGKSAVVKDADQIRGHFNLFNNDKMNRKFNLHGNVKVRCKIEHFDEDDNSTGAEEESLVFYNEGHSLDADVIPFEILIHNKSVDLENNEPLKIDIISELPKSYVISIKSPSDKYRCNFEIAATVGRTSIEIPAAMLSYDLDLKSHRQKKFDIYYVKYQGTTLSRMANSKFYKIENTELTFKYDKSTGLQPQSRIDPCGREYPKSFILSDRYLVLCPREYSGFAKKSEYGPEKIMDLTMLVHEGQHMENLAKEMQQFSAGSDDSGKIDKTQKTIQNTKHANARKIRPRIPSDQIQLMQGVSGAYESIISRKNQRADRHKIQTMTAAPSPQPKKPCAPCSRKKKKNA